MKKLWLFGETWSQDTFPVEIASKLGGPEPVKCVKNIVNMQSDAKSFFCKKSRQNDRPGLHFEGLWGHFGALWAPNGTPVAFF